MTESGPSPEAPSLEPPSKYPETLPLLIISDQVIFPLSMVPIRLGNAAEVKLVDDVVMGSKLLGIVTRRGETQTKTEAAEKDRPEDAYEVGCIARLLQLQRSPDSHLHIVVQSLQRFRVQGITQRDPYIVAKIEPLTEPPATPEALAPLMTTVKQQMGRLIALSPNIPDSAHAVLDNVDDANN